MRPRIRGRAPVLVGAGPVAGTTAVDEVGSFSIALTSPESIVVPTEAMSSDVEASSAETAVSSDLGTAQVILPAAAEPGLATPAESRSAEHTIGTASVTQASGSWTNPNNATGLPDTAYARYTAPAGIGSPRAPLGILIGSFATPPAPTRDAQVAPALIQLRVLVSIAGLTTGSVTLSISYNNGGSYQSLATLTASSPNGLMEVHTSSVAVATLNWAALPNLRWAVEADLQGSTLAASFVDVDAATVTLNTTGS